MATPVGLMVSFRRHRPDQLVQFIAGGEQDRAVRMSADPETSRSPLASSNYRSRNAAATSLETTTSLAAWAAVSRSQRRSNGESSQWLIGASVVAGTALPTDRRSRPRPQHHHATRTAVVPRPAPARQRALPGGAGITRCRRPNEVAQVLDQSPGWTRRIRRHVQDVVHVGDQHPRHCIDQSTTNGKRLEPRGRAAPIKSATAHRAPG